MIEPENAEVKELSLYDAVCRYTELKPSGPQFKGLSPFTVEKTPSLYVHPTKLGGCWKCFSTGCGGRGAQSFLDLVEKHGFNRLTPANETPLPLKSEKECGEDELPF